LALFRDGQLANPLNRQAFSMSLATRRMDRLSLKLPDLINHVCEHSRPHVTKPMRGHGLQLAMLGRSRASAFK